jgi:hypothetical protein
MSAPFAIGFVQKDGKVKYNISNYEEQLSNIIDILYEKDGESGYTIDETKIAKSMAEYFSESYQESQEEDTRWRALKDAEGKWIIRDYYMGHKNRLIVLGKVNQNAGKRRTRKNKTK